MVVLGGIVDGKLVRSVQVFDITQDQFANTGHQLPPLPNPCVPCSSTKSLLTHLCSTANFGIAVVDNNIFYSGGRTHEYAASREAYALAADGYLK